MMNGIAWGSILVVIGAAISYYSGMLLVKCSQHTGKFRYEDYALVLYNQRMATATSIINLLTVMGFIMSYIVYVRDFLKLIFLL